jgi:hypothetical protein
MPTFSSDRHLFQTLGWSFPGNLSKDSGSAHDQNLAVLPERSIGSLRLSFLVQLPLSDSLLCLTTIDVPGLLHPDTWATFPDFADQNNVLHLI